MQKWKVIEAEDVSPSKWFPIKKEKVRLQNGIVLDDYYYADLGDAATVLPILKTGEIVFVRQYKHGIQDVVLEFPSGFKQEGIDLRQSAAAELSEEVGIEADSSKFLGLGINAQSPTKLRHRIYGFLGYELEFNSRQNLDRSEIIDIVTLTPREVDKKIAGGEIWVSDVLAFWLKAKLMYPGLVS